MKQLILGVFLAAAVVSYGVTLLAQGTTIPPATNLKPVATTPAAKADPVSTEVDKLKIQNVLLRIELAQRQAQQAQSDFDKARAEAQALIQGLQVPGYDLDLQTFTYKAKVVEPVVPVVKK